MKKNQISFKDLLEAACDKSHRWLKKNRSKGLRWMVQELFENKKIKWINRYDAWNHICTIAGHGELSDNENSNICLAARELHDAFSHNTLDSVLMVLEKYKIDDEFID